MGIGKNIKTITKNKGITLLELSKKSGVPINTIYTLTSEDPKSATLRTLGKLAKALEVNTETLRTGKEYVPERDKRLETIKVLEKEIKTLEKEKSRLNIILKIIQALSSSEEKNWDYIEYLVAEAKRLDEEDQDGSIRG